uniref:Uncharacterized protein n=1 Tax=Esox lucius TaxID=8010 RepID=A0A3P9AQG8_ESOLU
MGSLPGAHERPVLKLYDSLSSQTAGWFETHSFNPLVRIEAGLSLSGEVTENLDGVPVTALVGVDPVVTWDEKTGVISIRRQTPPPSPQPPPAWAGLPARVPADSGPPLSPPPQTALRLLPRFQCASSSFSCPPALGWAAAQPWWQEDP